MLKSVCIVFIFTLLSFAGVTSYAQSNALFNSEGYRKTLYRSPTPIYHENAKTIAPAELVTLLQQQPNLLLIDVYRNPWLRGSFTLQEEHRNLPNSLWLANCGDGSLSEQWMEYCRMHLAQATANDTTHPIVFYCRADCWLGWNAIKRAHALGYRNMYWLRDGIDGWKEAGLSLESAQPIPLQKNLYKNEVKDHVQHLNR